MNPKALQYLMGHSDIGVTMNVYTHLGLEDAADELKRIEATACKEGNREKSGHIAGAAIIQISLILCYRCLAFVWGFFLL